MKLWVLLNFWDEDDVMLGEMIDSLAPLCPFCVIAQNGPYSNFPTDKVHSPINNYTTIDRAASAIGALNVFISTNRAFQGDEVEKRQKLLDAMFEYCTSKDFFLVADADYLLHRADKVRGFLETTNLDAVECSFFEGRLPDGLPGSYRARLLMRCTPGLRMERAHYLYQLPDGRHHHILGRDSTVPALDLTEQMLVEHRVHQRTPERRAAQTKYYERRDQGNLEG